MSRAKHGFRDISQFSLKYIILFFRTFMHLYQMDCPRARERLLVMGVPEQIKSSSHDEHSKVAGEFICAIKIIPIHSLNRENSQNLATL